MSKQPWTPGPWKLYGPTPLRPGLLGTILEVQTRRGVPVVKWAGFDFARDEHPQKRRVANARLIAAAPELYEALKMAEIVWANTLSLRYGSEPKDVREPVLNAMRAALAKARGETP